MADYINLLLGLGSKGSLTNTISNDQSTVDHHQSRIVDDQTPTITTQHSANDIQNTINVLNERERELTTERQRLSLQHWRNAQKKTCFNTQKQAGATSKYASYVPNCPHCGRANEYGDTMCDPVHPRICAGSEGDFMVYSSQVSAEVPVCVVPKI